jgi:hypothetical protein
MDTKQFFEDANSGKPRDLRTIFDGPDYKVTLAPDQSGESLRRRLIEISALYDNISRLSNHFVMQSALCEVKRKRVKAIAFKILREQEDYKKANLEDKKLMVEAFEVEINGEKTTMIDEEEKAAIFTYLGSRGKDKLKELSSNLDLGRSMFSWDKGAMEKGIR